MTPSKRLRFVALAALLAVASFYAGTHLVTRRPVPPVHPLTGRQIAGIATDASWLDRASREGEEAPDQALQLIGIHAGMVVADVGAGTGYMTTRLAELVGPTGRVYANDLQSKMLQIIQDKARAAGLSNVTIVQGTDTDARLPEGAIDLALLVDVYHEMWHPAEMLRSIRRSLKPEGELVLVEYRKEDPTIPIADTHRMSVTDVRIEVQAEGFAFETLIPRLPRQHIIVFRRGRSQAGSRLLERWLLPNERGVHQTRHVNGAFSSGGPPSAGLMNGTIRLSSHPQGQSQISAVARRRGLKAIHSGFRSTSLTRQRVGSAAFWYCIA